MRRDEPVEEPPGPPGRQASAAGVLLLECLDADPGVREQHLELLCSNHPDMAPKLRALHRLLLRFGMLAEPPGEDEDEGPALERIGPYRILEVLGIGGMGVVYLAEHEKLGRRVALKVIHAAMAETPKARERFNREALAASRLDHPGICPVYETGHDGGTPFLAMRHVPGRTLASAIAASRGAGRTCVELPRESGESDQAAILRFCERAAEALHTAHEGGLVHRDVKPGNLMVTPEGEPVLLDFGLASLADSDGALTLTGDQIGTPFYMAPEQITGRPTDRRTDVYALGVVLYECLILRPPFEASSRHDLFSQILREEAPDPRGRGRGIGRDLWTVLQTALCKEPERRYRSAQAFAEDLRRVRELEPILARRASPFLRLRRFARRNPLAASFVAFLIVAVLVFAKLVWQREQALTSTAIALDQASAVTKALRAERGGSAPAQALAMALEAVQVERNLDTVSALYQTVVRSRERARLHHERAVRDAHFSPDGNGKILVTCSDDRTARLWNRDGESMGDPLWHNLHVTGCEFSPEGSRLLTRSTDGTAAIWSSKGERQHVLPHGPMPELPPDVHDPDNHFVLDGRFSPNGEQIATCCRDGRPRIWNARTGIQVGADFTGHTDHGGVPSKVFWSPDSELVATVEDNQRWARDVEVPSVIVWRPGIDGHEVIARLPHPHGVTWAEFAPDGRSLLTACRDGFWRIWVWEDGARTEIVEQTGGELNRACFSPEGDRVLASSTSGLVSLWTRNGDFLKSVEFHDSITATFTQNGSRILTFGHDGAVRLLNLELQEMLQLRGHSERVEFAEMSPDGRQIVSASWDKTARIWDVVDPELPRLLGHEGRIVALARDASGAVVSVADDATIRIWDPLSAEARVLRGHSSHPVAVAMAPEGQRVAVASDDGRARLYDLESGLHREVPTGNWDLASAAFLNDGRLVLGGMPPDLHVLAPGEPSCRPFGTPRRERTYALAHAPRRGLLAAAGWTPLIAVWNDEGDLRQEWPVSESMQWVHALAFSHDERRLAQGANDRLVKIWDVSDLDTQPTLLFTLDGHEGRITSLAWSPDDSVLVSGSSDGSARLWDAGTGDPIAVLRGHGGEPVNAVLFSSDGGLVWTGGNDGAIQAWPTSVDELIEIARERVAALRIEPGPPAEQPLDVIPRSDRR